MYLHSGTVFNRRKEILTQAPARVSLETLGEAGEPSHEKADTVGSNFRRGLE